MSVDLSKIRKGSRVRLASGDVVLVSGLYLSGDGPVLMVKDGSSPVAARNVPASQVTEVLEG